MSVVTVRDVLSSLNEDSYLSKLAAAEKAAGNGGHAKRADAGDQPPGGAAPGATTAATPVAGGAAMPSGAQVTGAVEGGGPTPPLAQHLGGTSANNRIQLMEAAMAQAGQELAGGVAASRGPGTDEGHNAGVQPRTGEQQYAAEGLVAPASQVYQDPYQGIEEDNAGGMATAAGLEPVASDQSFASLLDRLAAHISGTEKTAGQPAPAPTQAEQEKIAAARELANECLAQGLFVEQGIRHGLAKSAEDGTLAGIFAPSIAAAHEVAFESMVNSDSLRKVAHALADEFVAAVGQKLGVTGQKA